MEFALEYKVKQSKNGKSPSHHKLAQLILKRKFSSVHKRLQKISPLIKAFEECKLRSLFSDFYDLHDNLGAVIQTLRWGEGEGGGGGGLAN